MKTFRLIGMAFMAVLLNVNLHAQEPVNLILKFWGYNNNPYKEAFIANNLSPNATQESIKELNDYYIQNEKEILAEYDNQSYIYYLERLTKTREQNRQNMAAGLNVIGNAVAQGIATGQQRQAEIKQQEAALKEQQRAEQQARVAQNKQKYAEFQAMTSRSVHTSNSTSTYNTQSDYNDMLTSDINKNRQVQMSVQQYGVDQTRNALNQEKANSIQANATSGYGGHIISAVTANRQAIKIQVRDKKIGGRIVAYSLGANFEGKQQWKPTDGAVSKCTSNLEYQYTAYLNGVGNIYFDM